MSVKIKYKFSAKVWKHTAYSSWHFVSLPEDISAEIRENFKWQENGWGRTKATAKVGKSQWVTSIWFDTKHKTHLLPIKTGIRKKERIEIGMSIQCVVLI